MEELKGYLEKSRS
nr:maturase K [Philodendron acutatum]